MLVQQAVYGPMKGHSFLKGSDDTLQELFRNAAWATDLPSTAPPGVTWDPFLRLVQVDDLLLLIATKPFEGPGRAGMVLSRAAFIPRTNVEQFGDLRPIARELQSAWDSSQPLAPLDTDRLQPEPAIDNSSLLAKQIANVLTKSNKKPVVKAGQEGFDSAMLELWTRVPPQFRPQLTFSLSFTPDDTREASVVCTPRELAGRWDASHLLEDEEPQEVTPGATLLLDLAAAKPIRVFAAELELPLDSPAAVQLALTAYRLWKEGSAHDDDISLLRVLAEKAGVGETASLIKSAVLKRVVASKEEWKFQDLLAMRNLELASFQDGPELWAAVSKWAENLEVRVAADAEAIVSASVSGRATAWVQAVSAGLRRALQNGTAAQRICGALWKALNTNSQHAKHVFELLDASKSSEQLMLRFVPSELNSVNADTIAQEALARGWWTLAGVALAVSRRPHESLATALKLQPVHEKDELIRASLARASDTEICDAVLVNPDPIAIRIAAEACVRTPAILTGFAWRVPGWYAILDAALDQSASIAAALPQPAAGLQEIIDAHLASEIVWRVISRTTLANLAEIAGRARAWELIPEKFLQPVLSATVNGWLLMFERGLATPNQLEEPLATAVKTRVFSRGFLLQVLQSVPAAFPQYLREFGPGSDAEVVALLDDLDRHIPSFPLSEGTAQELGRLIASRYWTNAAKRASQLMHHRQDLRPLLAQCYRILGIVDRLWVAYKLGVSVNLTPDEAWAAFESEATALYSYGPSDRELWSRSGGNNEDLPNEDTGRTAWHKCARDLRAGRAPGIRALLKVMSQDYPYNDTLRQLQYQRFED